MSLVYYAFYKYKVYEALLFFPFNVSSNELFWYQYQDTWAHNRVGHDLVMMDQKQPKHLFICSVQSLNCVQLFVTPWTAAHQASLSITNSRSLLKLMPIESVMPSNHLILCCPLLFLPSVLPSIRVFSNESALCIRWPKYWSFSFSIGPSNEYSGLTSFRMDWLDLLAVQVTLKSLLQHHSSKASILRRSAFFTVQLSHPYMTTGKTIALIRHSFVGKVRYLLFNMLSRWVWLSGGWILCPLRKKRSSDVLVGNNFQAVLLNKNKC